MSADNTAFKQNEKNVSAFVAELIQELAPSNPSAPVKPEDHLVDDLQYHSLALMEVAFTIEDEFGLEPIEEEAVMKINTVTDVVNYVLGELRSKGDLK